MNGTERSIREQFDFWRRAPLPAFTAEPGTSYAVVGCGSSLHVSKSIAGALCRLGMDARAIPGNEWTRRPHDFIPAHMRPHVLVLSRSGESSETVRAAQASRAAGLPVTAFTCTPDSTVTRHCDRLVLAESHPDEHIVMTASTSLLLLLGLRFAGIDIAIEPAANAARAALQALEDGLESDDSRALAGRSHFVFLGGGALYGIACEAALKLQEMSLGHVEAYYPLEYRHGPISLIDQRSLVVLLSHPETVEEEAVLAGELREKGAYVLNFGGPGDASIALPPEPWPRGLICLPALQWLGERVARWHGLNSEAPRHLSKVVLTA